MAAGRAQRPDHPRVLRQRRQPQALDMLLYNMNVLLPSADTAAVGEDAAASRLEITARPRPHRAYVFKTVADPFVGKLSFIKVLSGKV